MAVEAPILDGLGDMRYTNARISSKVGDGARDLEHAVIRAGRQVEARAS